MSAPRLPDARSFMPPAFGIGVGVGVGIVSVVSVVIETGKTKRWMDRWICSRARMCDVTRRKRKRVRLSSWIAFFRVAHEVQRKFALVARPASMYSRRGGVFCLVFGP